MTQQPFARLFQIDVVGQVLLHLNANLITVEFIYAEMRHTYEMSFESDDAAHKSFTTMNDSAVSEIVTSFVEQIDNNSLADLLEPDAALA